MAENNNTFDNTVEALFKGMENFITTKTVVGDAITIDGTIILPLVDVSFGIGAGASNNDKKNNGGGGMGSKMSPSAVLVIKNGEPKLVNIKEQDGITKLGENRVFYLPYLMGERSPHNNPDARGVFFGMSMDTTRADMTQAVLEGVAFGLRDSLEVARSLGIKIERTKICGGGAKSPLWKKIIANVMNLKVDVLENEEGPSMGGAMLAAVGCGAYPDVETIGKKFAKVVDTVEPDPELVAKYEERYQKFRTLYPAMKPLF